MFARNLVHTERPLKVSGERRDTIWEFHLIRATNTDRILIRRPAKSPPDSFGVNVSRVPTWSPKLRSVRRAVEAHREHSGVRENYTIAMGMFRAHGLHE